MLQAVSDCLQDLLKCTSKDMSVCSRLTCRSTARAARLRSRSHMFVLMSSAAAEPEHNASNIRNCHACLCGVTRMIIKGTCAMQTGQCDQLRLHATMESLAKTQHLSTEYATKCSSSSDFARHRDCPGMYVHRRETVRRNYVVLELHAGVSCCEQQAAILCVDLPLLGIL